jgi:hypothetical protein
LTPPAPLDASVVPGKLAQIHVNDFVHVLLALALVIAAARTLGAIFRWVHQPPVVGEMIAGILLGPSFLGHLAPGFAAYILPQSIAPLLNVISQFGVILYMFLVGLELDLSSYEARVNPRSLSPTRALSCLSFWDRRLPFCFIRAFRIARSHLLPFLCS